MLCTSQMHGWTWRSSILFILEAYTQVNENLFAHSRGAIGPFNPIFSEGHTIETSERIRYVICQSSKEEN